MRESRHKNIWNPQIAFGVVAICVLAAVWLNMAKLRMGLGQPEHDISQVPLARNITSDQIEELRNGKPLQAILAEPPAYDRQLRQPEVASKPRLDQKTSSQNFVEQTSTLFSPRDRGSDTPQSQSPGNSRQSSSELRPTEDNPTAKPIEASESSLPAVLPSDVPRSNPSLTDNGQTGGGSFLEKFPGKTATLPNLQNGPAMKEPTPAPIPESGPQFAAVPLPSANQLAPPPFGDFSPATAEPLTRSSASPEASQLVKPVAFDAPSPAERVASPIGTAEPTASLSLPSFDHASPTAEAAAEYPTRLTREGDTWWSLAQELYDDGRLFRELYAHNQERVQSYDRIPAGTEIVCPPADVLRAPSQRAAELQSKSNSSDRMYRTRVSDTLFNIAREQLGQASRFGELLQQNKDRLPARTGHLSALPEGLELKLPRR
jgi:nucleoid-associated protein YgaU